MILSPEWKAVLACARSELVGNGHEAPVQEALKKPVDWRRMGTVACQNRVGPLVYSALRRVSLPPVAKRSLELLRTAYLATAARNAIVFGALEVILEAFSVERIPLIVLKGAALAATVYPDRAFRPMSDVDLLVREEDLGTAERALRSVGYEVALDPKTKEELRVRHHHWLFRSARPRAGGVPVELHWNLDPPGGPVEWDIDALFERAASFGLTRGRALLLGPEDSLLHLSLHLCRHRFNGGVIALCDIAGVTTKYEGRLDWAKVQSLAREVGASEHLVVALGLARELMGANVPVDVRAEGAQSGRMVRTVELARERILEEKGGVRGAAELKLRWRRRGFGGRMAAARRALLPETGHAGPAWADIQPTYLARLAKLVRSYGPLLWALVRHRQAVSAVVEREARKSALDSWCSATESPTRLR